ncbi:type I-E CRISPR-associated protein Cas5/CasD [Streptomyces zhihengii]|uniref:Type I-E CRISPR-associated protein Cas5/CasD n=1 Tax=Streptomyces zhihengii TaxID=1818004 RepID=A0ABS2V4W0_9ACTN|nr:type I-E CRISPR-associated protein Cas5/CasD [Streptomyces zhihengii]MBM9624673.1 type I-E CRISPR-associated protein Cas5/CasD [Streptomyces zhihengii]
MTTLLLRLAGPLQSWGASARFVQRTTENAPTKSGVLGLLAGAEGRPRDADLSDLAALRFGVRIDRPGSRIRDFHTAENRDTGRALPLSDRYYLADAVFLAGVEGEDTFIRRLYTAVDAPRFLPYLGRRSCPPSHPLLLQDNASLSSLPLEDALRNTPWQGGRGPLSHRPPREQPPAELNMLLDCPPQDTPDIQLRDTPLSYNPSHRRYAMRGIQARHATASAPVHDPTAHLRPAPTARHDSPAPPLATDDF